MKEKIIGYKNVNKNMTCNNHKFEIGKWYEVSGEVVICSNGFHFHKNPFDLFKYYDKKSLVFEIEAIEVIDGNDKSVCKKIKLIKEIKGNELKKLGNQINNFGWGNSGDLNSGDLNSGDLNSGDRNSGDRNSGDRNSGYRNSGDLNSGDRNSGDLNSGDWNSGNKNTGFFNSETPINILVFNKFISTEIWNKAIIPSFLYFNLLNWVWEIDMTEKEKEDNPTYKTTGGFLKTMEYKEAFKLSFSEASNKKEQIQQLKALPNFDAKVFEKISSIKIK